VNWTTEIHVVVGLPVQVTLSVSAVAVTTEPTHMLTLPPRFASNPESKTASHPDEFGDPTADAVVPALPFPPPRNATIRSAGLREVKPSDVCTVPATKPVVS